MMTDEKQSRWFKKVLSLGRETLLTSWELIRIMVPVVIITRILDEFGFITVLSSFLEPVMGAIGLPGELGIVWATGMLTTIYGAMAVFATLVGGLDLTVAQVTVLCSALLFAHSLPIELSISKKAGAALWPIALLRVGGAIVYCSILHWLCITLDIWQQQATMLFSAVPTDLSYFQWAIQQGKNIVLIILVIFCILVTMRILRRLGILTLIEKGLAPILPLFGMGKAAAPITVVGMIMGLGYGGALIIRDTASGKMTKKEIFNSLAMMGLCHGLVEDTLLMVALGGRLGGIFWGRIVFSLLVIYLLVRLQDLYSTKIHCQTP